MPATAVSTRALVKRYRDVTAVDSLNLDVRRGEIYGFLGRNGAGKTTTIRMLLGLIRPSSGEVTVLGRRIMPGETSVFSRVGFLVETATAYPNLTVRENLDIQRRLTGSPPRSVDDSIALLRLDPVRRRGGPGSSRSATSSASRSPARPFGLIEQLGHRSPAGPPRQGTLLYLGGRPLLVLQLPDDADCFNVCGEAGFLS